MDSHLVKLSKFEVLLDEPIADETGRGCYGVVFKSKLNGAVVVVKKLHDILMGTGGHVTVSEVQWKSAVGKFIDEIELLSNQRHPNIVQFLGVHGLSRGVRNISLVMEKMDMDLKEFVLINKGNIPLSVKLSILKDTANGITHLHSKNIVHRDLNSGNVLLTPSLQAKVADLGVARIINRQQVQQGLTMGPGALDFMPPEARSQNPVYGPKLDCFSFGHLSLHLVNEEYPDVYELTSEDPVPQQGEIQIAKRSSWFKMLGDKHPLYHLIRTCLQDDPKKRFEMKRINAELEKMTQKDEHKVPQFMELLRKQKEYEEYSKSQTEKFTATEEQNTLLNKELKEQHETHKRNMQQKEEEIKQNLKNSLKKELRKELEDFYKQQMRELVNENEKKTKEMSKLKAQLVRTEQERNQLMQKLEETQHKFEKALEQREQEIKVEMKNSLSKELQAELEHHKQQIRKLTSETEQQRKEVNNLKSQLETVQQEKNQLTQKTDLFRKALKTSQQLACQLEECIKASLEHKDQESQSSSSAVKEDSASGKDFHKLTSSPLSVEHTKIPSSEKGAVIDSDYDTHRTSDDNLIQSGGATNSASTMKRTKRGSFSRPKSLVEIKGPYKAHRLEELEKMTQDSSYKERFRSTATIFEDTKPKSVVPDRSKRMEELDTLISKRNKFMDEQTSA